MKLINARVALAYFEGKVSQIPSVELFLSMYVRKEALMSSQIEGTQATLEDILDPNIDNNTNKDIEEVINYVKAINYAIDKLNDLPFCNRFIKEIHSELMAGVRGQEKTPGEFRTSQNWIGGHGVSLKDARYIPPNVEDMQESMIDLENYINDDEDDYALIKAALFHYQFETIHPFLDGNGRLGRILVVLYLLNKKVISSPTLYISYFLKKNQVEYYDRMMEVRNKGNYEQWIEFFLEAIEESANDASSNIDKISKLHNENIDKINNLKNNKNVKLVFNYLESNPIIEIKETSIKLDISYNTVDSAVHKLIDLNILIENEKKGRSKTYSYIKYLDILKEGTE